jgi:ElaB/YqjD/DUF883 family membrane-anchored ribosome-binding protein
MAGETTSDQAGPDFGRAGNGNGNAPSQSARDADAGAADLRRRAGQKVDKMRAAAARRLDSAASVMHERTDRAAAAVHGAADSLSKGADYVRTNEVREMAGDVMSVVRNNPGPALIAAVTLGFLLGRILSRN